MAQPLTDKEKPRLSLPPRPGPAYYLMGAALTAALVSATPFFWVPPFWVVALMARMPVANRKARAATAGLAEPATLGQASLRPGSPVNDNPGARPIPASTSGAGAGCA